MRLSNGNFINVSETIVHPKYNPATGPYYNNIAILKLPFPVSIIPACVWYNDIIPDPQFEVIGKGRADLVGYNRDERVTTLSMFQPYDTCRINCDPLLYQANDCSHLRSYHHWNFTTGNTALQQRMPAGRTVPNVTQKRATT